MRLRPEERVAELAARGQGPSPANFYNWLKVNCINYYVITTGNAVRTDPHQRSAFSSFFRETKKIFYDILFLQPQLLFSSVPKSPG